jgi:hypothetical protein
MKRLNINVSDGDGTALETIAEEDGITVTEAVRRAIAADVFLRDARARGERVLLQDSAGATREILFR